MRTAFTLLPVVAGIFAAAFAAPSHAVGGPSGLKVGYAVQGTLGETIVNEWHKKNATVTDLLEYARLRKASSPRQERLF